MRENGEARETRPEQPSPTAFVGDWPAPPCAGEEYDEWFRAKVQQSLDDAGEKTYSHDEVMAAAQIIIDGKRLEKELRERTKS